MIRRHCVAASANAEHHPAAPRSGVFFCPAEFVTLELHHTTSVKTTDQLPQNHGVHLTT